MTVLEIHDGRDVIGCKMQLTNVGDGLSEAMRLEPVRLHAGERVLVLVEAIVLPDKYDPAIKGDLSGPLHLTYRLKGEAAMLYDATAAQKAIDKHKGRLDKMAQIPGQQSIIDDMTGEATEEGEE